MIKETSTAVSTTHDDRVRSSNTKRKAMSLA